LIEFAPALKAPRGMGIAVDPPIVPINVCETDPFLPDPTTWPELFSPSARVVVHPEGIGISVLPDVVPTNAC
jgi:hypothetical protein